MDYDLSRLSSRSFEQLIQAIGAEVLGEKLVIFGDGPDGGREALVEGPIHYPSYSEPWSGTTVIQAKFRQRPQGTGNDGDWAVEQLQQELATYEGAASKRSLPDNLIFATNVTCSAVLTAGAKDRMFALAESCDLVGFDLWDYDKLRVYLDRFSDIRRAFSAYLLPGDVLSALIDTVDSLKSEAPDFDSALSRFLQKELLADQFVNLEQAGRSADDQVPVSRVFVDLPVFDERQPAPPDETTDGLVPGFIAEIIDASASRLDPRSLELTRRARGNKPDNEAPKGRIVLIGGPGQGKSTIGQFACQLFRTALLDSRPPESLSPEALETVRALKDHCARDGIDMPTVRRFPMRVELSRFADQLGRQQSLSLLEFLASQVSARISSRVPPMLMSTWLSEYPSLLVLDGLDEVPPSSNRETLIAAIKEFFVDIHQGNADCMVIATTRPQGYSEEFSPQNYRHRWLAPLSEDRALRYADRLLLVRFPADDARRADIDRRLRRSWERPETARLLTSPLQVTIMATLLERMGQPPEGRWNLFSQYYQVIYHRELEREIPAAEVLRHYKPDIDAIHHRVGLLLQVESEEAQTEPRMSRGRFAEIVKMRLSEEGHDATGEESLTEQIIEAAMERLVFLVGVEADNVGFEIRSLQEFMAAEALLDADDQQVGARLRSIADLPAWRNVLLFASGRCFANRQHLRDTIHTICVEANDVAADDLALLALPGSTLAIDLLADGVASNQPRYERLLASVSLRVLRLPANSAHQQLIDLYRPNLQRTYEEAAKDLLVVKVTDEKLGTLSVLAGLQARDVDWSERLLEDNLPSGDSLDGLLAVLPARSCSPWLAGKLAGRLADFPPHISFDSSDAFDRLGLSSQGPYWFRAITTAFTRAEPSNRDRYSLRDTELRFGLRTISDRWAPVLDADESLREGDESALPSSWALYRSIIHFAAKPSAQSLRAALEAVTPKSLPPKPEHFLSLAPWPLAAALLVASDTDSLPSLIEATQEGRLGDRPDWIAAEQRWSGGLTVKDFADRGDGKVPFDASVRNIGFPVRSAGVSTGDQPVEAAGRLLEVLGQIRDQKARQFLVHAVLWLLSYRTSLDAGLLEPKKILSVVEDSDFGGSNAICVEALNRIEWSPSLSDEEAHLMDLMGRGAMIHSGFGVANVREGLLDRMHESWLDKPCSGVYRLLAVSTPLHQSFADQSDALISADVEDRAARAILRLKLEAPLDNGDFEALAKDDDDLWLPLAAEVLGSLGDGASAEAITGKLFSYLKSQGDRSLFVTMALDLIANRRSQLSDQTVWESLDLFPRPGG